MCVADMNLDGAKSQASKLGNDAIAVQVNASDWDSQLAAFEKAVDSFGRIDYVFPIAGIGERKAIKNDPKAKGFQKPDLSVIDVDLTGVLYTAFLAIQQMRRQDKDDKGSRGKSQYCLARVWRLYKLTIPKVAVTASVCGFYCVPSEYTRRKANE